MEKKSVILSGLGMLAIFSLGYFIFHFSRPSEVPIDRNATVTSNFYQAINKEWFKNTNLPSDSSIYGVFDEIQDSIDKKLEADIQNLVSGKEASKLLGMDEFITFYKLASDYKRREKEGVSPIKPYLRDIEDLNSLQELSKTITQRTLDGLAQPYGISIIPDPKDTSKKLISLDGPDLFLIDLAHYKDEETKNEMSGLFKSSTENLLIQLGYSKNEAETIVKGALAFDDKLVPYLQWFEGKPEGFKFYDFRGAEEIKSYSKVFDFSRAINELVNQDVDEINISNPVFFESFDKIISEENFNDIKSWMIVKEAIAMSPYVSDAVRIAGGEFKREISGVKTPISKEEAVFNLSVSKFSPIFSTYYGQKYFGKKVKDDVTEMVNNIVGVYKNRLIKNDWLMENTKSKAIEKLDNMTYSIGYPEEVSKEMGIIDVNPNKTLVDNVVDLNRTKLSYQFEHYNEPVNKADWIVNSYEVNAFYNPANNSITFPAAILNEPFYSEKQSVAQNYGGIGTIIGHEITHAFDSSGSYFDKDGNMADWWTIEDRNAFKKKTYAMFKLWDEMEIYGGKVNGQQTLDENIADAGGLSASLETLKEIDQAADLKPFFENYAKVYRKKITSEYAEFLLTRDTHAPDELRVNIQLKNIDDFYKTYNIKETDEMFLPEDKRVSVW